MAMMTRYDPFREMLSLRDAMDRLFQESVIRPTSWFWGAGVGVPMDVQETADHYEVRASLPGWKPEEINITVQNDTLTISGQRKPEEERREEGKTYHLRERVFTSFSRSFTFPTAVEADKAQARYENGELMLTLPKAVTARAKQIKITTGQAQLTGSR